MSTTDRATVSAAAGYQVPEGSELYRGYVIAPGSGLAHPVAFQHKDYAGPEDGRAGEAASFDAAKADIDERIDEGFDLDAPPVGYAVRLGGAA